MREPLSNKKCLLQHHFTCPACGTTGQHAIRIFDADDRKKYGVTSLQCLDCFNFWSTVYDDSHNVIGHKIERK